MPWHEDSSLHNDKLNKLSTGCAEVYTLSDSKNPLTEEHLFQKYSQVFSEVVGLLEGEYHIRLDRQVEPVQHAPRRVPVALRDRLREALI